MKLEIAVLLDEAEIGRIVRIGLWELTIDYETEETTWEWRGEYLTARELARQRTTETEDLRPAPQAMSFRRTKVSVLRRGERVVETDVWKVFEP